MQKIVLVLALLLSTSAGAFNAVYDDTKNLLSISGLEYRRGHYDVDLVNVGGFVFIIDNVGLSDEITTANYDNESDELSIVVLYHNDEYKVILKDSGDFNFVIQEAQKLTIDNGFEGTWEENCKLTTSEDLGIYDAGKKEILIIDGENLIHDEYWYVNSYCSGDLIFKQRTIHKIYHEGQKTTLDGQLVDKVKTKYDEVISYIFDPFLLSLLADEFIEKCGSAPILGEPNYGSKCSPNYLGDVEYRIYKIVDDVLYLITWEDKYPDYMPIDSIFFFYKYSRVE